MDASGSTAPKHVLVVDDDRLVRETMTALVEAEGYTTETAANGAEALVAARRRRPDAIVLDLVMPVMDGQEFLRIQRQDPVLRDVPTVVISASARPPVDGVTVLLNKPLDFDALLAVLARCIAGDADAGELAAPTIEDE